MHRTDIKNIFEKITKQQLTRCSYSSLAPNRNIVLTNPMSFWMVWMVLLFELFWLLLAIFMVRV